MMVSNPARIQVTTDTDLPTLLEDAENGPVLLERDGKLFRLALVDDIAYEPDAELVRRTLSATAGTWADIDVDRVIEEVYEARRTGSRPADRP